MAFEKLQEKLEPIEHDATIEMDFTLNDFPFLLHVVRNIEKETLTIYLQGEVLLSFHLGKNADLKLDTINLAKNLQTLRLRDVIDDPNLKEMI